MLPNFERMPIVIRLGANDRLGVLNPKVKKQILARVLDGNWSSSHNFLVAQHFRHARGSDARRAGTGSV
jgi:hypothetical protein